MKLRARWRGPLPLPGDVLRSPRRPRFAYAVDRVVVSTVVADVSYATIYVERLAAADVPPGAIVHAWTWDPRGRSRKTSS